jgi:hypothetical protein
MTRSNALPRSNCRARTSSTTADSLTFYSTLLASLLFASPPPFTVPPLVVRASARYFLFLFASFFLRCSSIVPNGNSPLKLRAQRTTSASLRPSVCSDRGLLRAAGTKLPDHVRTGGFRLCGARPEYGCPQKSHTTAREREAEVGGVGSAADLCGTPSWQEAAKGRKRPKRKC